MQTIAYPIALRTTLAELQLARETMQLREQDYQTQTTGAIADAKRRLMVLGSPMDATWTDTGADGSTPRGMADNPNGFTMMWYKAEQL